VLARCHLAREVPCADRRSRRLREILRAAVGGQSYEIDRRPLLVLKRRRSVTLHGPASLNDTRYKQFSVSNDACTSINALTCALSHSQQ
jgi:hypothetical protein